MSELEEELDRLNFDYEEQPVEVTPKIDFSNLRFDGVHYNLIQDRPTHIPFWIGKVLQELDIVKFTSDKSESFHQLKGVNQEERNSHNLKELDDLFYRMILKEIDTLSENSSANDVFKLRSIERNFQQIFEKRTGKILDMVRTDQKMNNSSMTNEETWFYTKLNNLYTNWRKQIGTDVDLDYEIEIQALVDINQVPFDSEYNPKTGEFSSKYISIRENEKKMVPLVVAEVLENHKLATITSSGFIDRASLSNILDQERRTEGMLTKIDPMLYHFIDREIKRLKGKPTSHNLSQLSEYQGALNFILRLRIRKIIKNIADPYTVDIQHATPEEEWLYHQMKRIYDDWNHRVAGAEEVVEEFDPINQEDFTSSTEPQETPSEWGMLDPEELAYLESLDDPGERSIQER